MAPLAFGAAQKCSAANLGALSSRGNVNAPCLLLLRGTLFETAAPAFSRSLLMRLVAFRVALILIVVAVTLGVEGPPS